jgi:hypothetical protein
MDENGKSCLRVCGDEMFDVLVRASAHSAASQVLEHYCITMLSNTECPTIVTESTRERRRNIAP